MGRKWGMFDITLNHYNQYISLKKTSHYLIWFVILMECCWDKNGMQHPISFTLSPLFMSMANSCSKGWALSEIYILHYYVYSSWSCSNPPHPIQYQRQCKYRLFIFGNWLYIGIQIMFLNDLKVLFNGLLYNDVVYKSDKCIVDCNGFFHSYSTKNTLS